MWRNVYGGRNTCDGDVLFIYFCGNYLFQQNVIFVCDFTMFVCFCKLSALLLHDGASNKHEWWDDGGQESKFLTGTVTRAQNELDGLFVCSCAIKTNCLWVPHFLTIRSVFLFSISNKPYSVVFSAKPGQSVSI